MIRLTKEQAQQIEEALEDIVRVFKFETGTPVEALAAIRAARAQEQAEQEPVYAFRRKGQDSFCTCDKERYEELSDKPNLFEVATFYAAPVQQVDLTDDEIQEVMMSIPPTGIGYFLRIARAVIAAYKETNRA